MSSNEPMRSSPFLKLPFEIRARIWTILYTDLTLPHLRWHHDITEARYPQPSSFIATAPAFICKYLHKEVIDTIYRHLRLHLTRRPGSQTHHTAWPRQIHRIRHVTWYFTKDITDRKAPYGLPAAPLPLWLFPQLEKITIRFPSGEWIEDLPVGYTASRSWGHPGSLYEMALDDAIDEYIEMGQEERIDEWRDMPYFTAQGLVRKVLHPPAPGQRWPEAGEAAEGGRRRWMHCLLDLEGCKTSSVLPGESSAQEDFELWDRHMFDGSAASDGTQGQAHDEETGRFIEFGKCVNVPLEVELWCLGSRDRGGMQEPVVVTVDCTTQEIVQTEELSHDAAVEMVQQGLTARWIMEGKHSKMLTVTGGGKE